MGTPQCLNFSAWEADLVGQDRQSVTQYKGNSEDQKCSTKYLNNIIVHNAVDVDYQAVE